MSSLNAHGALETGPRRYKAVIVSPHLDDAVFSCGGLIAQLAQQGPVLVLNIFTRFLGTKKVRAVVLGPERYDEEHAAARFLGVSSHNMDELDASFRRPAYQSLGNIFAPPVKEDVDGIDAFRERIFGFLAGLEYERLYVPLGIGWHVDHILTHSVFQPWAGRDNVFYYEDAPYCFLPHATQYRLNELGSYPRAADDRSLAPNGKLRAWWEISRAYARTAIMRNLRPWIVRKFAVPVVSLYLGRLLAVHRRLGRQAAQSRQRPALEPTHVSIVGDFSRKVDAMALYQSQFREFFSDREDCVSMLTSYSERIAPGRAAVERYWRVMAHA